MSKNNLRGRSVYAASIAYTGKESVYVCIRDVKTGNFYDMRDRI